MNVERLHLIVLTIRQELIENYNQLSQVVSHLQNQVKQSQQPNHQEALSKTLDEWLPRLDSAESNSLSPAWQQSLEELKLSGLLGEALASRVREIFGRNTITPSVALEELKAIQAEANGRKQGVDHLVGGMRALEIGKDELDPGRVEVGVQIPRAAVDSSLEGLEAELHEVRGIVRCFQELVTGRVEPIVVRGLASSDFAVLLEQAPIVGAAIALAIERLLKGYDTLLSIRLRRRELRESGVPQESLKGIDDHAETIMTECVEEVIRELLAGGKAEGTRVNELVIHLRHSLNKIANRIDRGFSFEVRAGAQPEGDDGEQADEETTRAIGRVVEIGGRIRFPEVAGPPILELPEGRERGDREPDVASGDDASAVDKADDTEAK